MDVKDKTQDTVESILAELHAKIDILKERVEKLCESTDCLESAELHLNIKKKKNAKK
jgi:hypothetical protein